MSIPYFPLFVTDYEADTVHLTVEEDGAYFRLLRLQWKTPGCTLPDDNDWIQRRVRAHDNEFQHVYEPVIEEFFQRKNGRIFNARLLAEFKKANRRSVSAKTNGMKGGRPPKSLKNKEKDKSNGLANQNPAKSYLKPEPYKEKETKEKESVEVVSWDQVSPHDIHLQRPDDPLTEYTEGELAMLNAEFDLLDIEGELTSLVDWAWNKGIVNDNERKRRIHSILKKKQMGLEAGRALLDRPPAAPVSKEALENLNSKRAR